MRASDIVRGKISAPEKTTDGSQDKVLLSDIPGQSDFRTHTTPPAFIPERPLGRQTPVDNRPFAAGGQSLYNRAVQYLQELRERLPLSGEPPSLDQPLRIIVEMLAEPALVEEMYQHTLAAEHSCDFEVFSAVNTMVYSFKIGVRMGYAPFQMTELCLAALYHDIGMFLVPKPLITKPGELTHAEWAEIKKHTETGRDLLQPHDVAYPHVSRAVYEHHEREGGQGYPHGIAGEMICEYAKVIGICDSYEAMSHSRPYRDATTQYLSVLKLVETKDLFFPTSVVKAFLNEFTMYPAGSYVRLNNKSVGIVVGPNRNNPFKPTVRIIADGQGIRIFDEKLIDLADTAILNIVTGISAEEVPK
ncbi:MAG: HD domain-containing phosphohydrolase [Thermodesulfobacteriota bacterium]